jgi:predicted O-methyltransferase YrrM
VGREPVPDPPEPIGIDFEASAQRELVATLARYPVPTFASRPSPGRRYYSDNAFFSPADATVLARVLQYLQPNRVIEVGSGFSSALMLDTIDGSEALAGMRCTFIDPNPGRLLGLLGAGDRGRVEILERPVQQVATARFEELGRHDVLFIDSSHVVKAGSDVTYLLGEVLPRLAVGVWVHVHDIFYPFEYPTGWLRENRAWNELYALRFFLTDNPHYRVRLFNSYLHRFHADEVARQLPGWDAGLAGSSIWLERVEGKPAEGAS